MSFLRHLLVVDVTEDGLVRGSAFSPLSESSMLKAKDPTPSGAQFAANKVWRTRVLLRDQPPSGQAQQVFVWRLDEEGLEDLQSTNVPWFAHMFDRHGVATAESDLNPTAKEEHENQVIESKEVTEQEFDCASVPITEPATNGDSNDDTDGEDVILVGEQIVTDRIWRFVQEFSTMVFRNPPVLSNEALRTIQHHEEFDVAVIDGFLATIGNPVQHLRYGDLCLIGALKRTIPPNIASENVLSFCNEQLTLPTNERLQKTSTASKPRWKFFTQFNNSFSTFNPIYITRSSHRF